MTEDEAKAILRGVVENNKPFNAHWIHHLVFWAEDINGNRISWCQRESTDLKGKDV